MARRVTSPVLVGRRPELQRLEAVMAAAMEGEPGHVIVGGEAGVGKTRLLGALREHAEQAGVRVLVGSCVAMGDTGLPFAPYAEILRDLVARDGATRVAAIAGRASVDLARLVPSLGASMAPPTQELWAQTRMYEAFLDLLRRYAQQAPLVVQLEDLHWADAGTLAATSFLLRAIVDEPIFILATYREDEVVRTHPLRAWLAEVARFERVERLVLEPLDDEQVAELTTHITGDRPSLELTKELVRRSDGNPFFVEELLCCGPETSVTLPETLREVLLTRVDALSDGPRQLIGVAAVAGRDVSHDLLVSVGGAGLATTSALREVVDAGLLMPYSDARGDGYRFRHALLQEAIYDSLLPHERRHLHGAFGVALDGSLGADASDAAALVELAHHWRDARDPRAFETSMRAGRAAMEGYAFDVATRELEHALELWDASQGLAERSIERVDLLALLGRSAYLASQFRRSETATRAAIAALGEAGDLERRTILTEQLARILWVSGQYRASLETYEEAFRLAPTEPSLARVKAVSGLGQAYMLFGRYARAVELCREAVALARSLGLRDVEGHALNTLGTSLAAGGRTEEGLRTMDESLAIALELGLPDDIGRAHVNRGDILSYGGRPAAALESTWQGIEAIAPMGIESSYGSYLRHNGVRFAFESGSWEAARELLAEGDRRAPEGAGSRFYRAVYALQFLVASGAAEAAATWRETHAVLLESPSSSDDAMSYGAAIEMHAMDGRSEDAMRLAREAIDFIGPADPGRYSADLARICAWPIADVGLLARRGADQDGAVEASGLLDRLVELVDASRTTMGDPGGPLGEVLRLDRMQVQAERARMEGAATAETWRTVAEGWTETGFPYLALYARWREAEAAEQAGDRTTAAATLKVAHAAAVELGARPLAALMEGLARRMRLRLAPADATAPTAQDAERAHAYGLTRREREVLALVAAGRTNRQVADELFISESTAGVHVSNIMGKLGVSTRTEAASVALSQGLVGR